MKRFRFTLAVLTFCFITFTDYAQMQSANWRSVPTPGGTIAAIESGKAQIDQMPNGNWYFTYADESDNSINVKRFDIESQTWTSIFSQQGFAWLIMDVDTYIANNKLYFGFIDDDEAQFNFSLWEMDDNESVIPLMAGETSSVPLTNLTLGEFVVVNDRLYLASVSDADYNVDVYNLTTNALDASYNVGVFNYSVPDIVVDRSDNSLVVSGKDASNDYFVYKSQIGVSLNFTPINGNGFVTTPLIPGNANGNYFKLIEKQNNSPECVFIYSDGGIPYIYRVGLYSNTVAHMQFNNPNVLDQTSVAQFGDNTYVSGLNPIVNNIEMWEVDQNGSSIPVADDNIPSVVIGYAEALVTSFSRQGPGRAAVFYHLINENGFSPGNFSMTNNRPTIASANVVNGCNGTASNIIKDLSFSDLDGDYIKVVTGTFSSTNQTVIDPASISAFENGTNNWDIQAQGLSAGSTQISFSYTDGFDTLTSVNNITVVDPATVSFTQSTIEECASQGYIDLNNFVDSPGGRFTIGDFLSEDGMIPFDTLEISSLPYSESIFYEYVDANGCITNANAAFALYDSPTATLNVANSTCGDSNGTISATVDSPNGTFNNYWNTGDQNVTSISGLAPGTYYINIIDEKGCTGMSQANLQSTDVNLTGTVSNASCFGSNDGGIQLSINGANGPYNVLWSSGHSTPTVSNLSAGSYTAIVSNGNGCTVSETFTVNQPDKIELEYFKSSPDCGMNNGSVEQMMIQGGVGNYSYLWTSGGTGQDMLGVPAGSYGLQVSDDNGCTVTRSFQLNPIGGAGVFEDVTKAVCGTNSGSIELDVFPAAGESITSIEWSNGETTEDIYNLAPGIYSCQIEQTNGCTADYSWEVKARRAPRPEICIVTVDTSTTTNLVVWEKPAVNIFDIAYYKIYRETNVTGQFQLIDTVQYSSISVFNDVVASPLTRSWRYRISAVTSCGTESIPSTAHKTIHLVMTDLGNGDYKVVWDNYEGFPYTSYDLLRYTDLDGEWVTVEANIPFNTLPSDTTTPPSTQNLNYMIEVTPPGGTCVATVNKAQDYNSSRSNKPRSDFNPGDGTGDPNNSLVTNESEDYTVAMYPNPTDGKFEIALYHEQSNIQMDVKVVNLQGQLIYNGSIVNGVNYIDLGSVESGVYFVNVEDGNTSERMKIVIK